MPAIAEQPLLSRREGFFCGQFSAMASPCEVLIETEDESIAWELTSLAQQEALRIEHKFSRYRTDNIISHINNANGQPVTIDSEVYRLCEFASICYQLSDGMFDITAGVLRKVWHFDGSDTIPDAYEVSQLLPFIGWENVTYTPSSITLPVGYELDFGGIGKEYAVDRVATLCLGHHPLVSVVINFGGDIQVTRRRANETPWYIGIENPIDDSDQSTLVRIYQGGLATSGDSQRFLLKDGQRYSHILDPKTGSPVKNPPRSVTVAAPQCTQAGLLATLSLLKGVDAEAFLQEQQVTHWIYR